MEDFKEVLQKLKEDFGENIEVDITKVISEISPAKAGAVEDAKSRNVFSIPASMDDNKKLFDLLNTDNYNRPKIMGVCSSYYLLGGCPLEMLLFMLRVKKGNSYTDLYSIILDVLSSNKEEKINSEALHHIIKYWTWYDSKLVVLKLIGEGVGGLADDVKQFALANITDLKMLDALQYTFKNVDEEYIDAYKVILHELMHVLNVPDKYGLPELNEEIVVHIQNCIQSLGSSDTGHKILFEAYKENTLRSRAKTLVMKATAYGLTNNEISEIGTILTGDYNSGYKDRVEDLLRFKAKKNKLAQQILDKLTATGVCSSKLTIEDNINIIKDTSRSKQSRQRAVLFIGDYGSEEHIGFIDSLKGKDKEFDLYCAEALVTLGVESELVTVLFNCLANSQNPSQVRVASNLVKKLILNKSGRTSNVANIMHDLLKGLMQQQDNDKTIAGIKRLLDIYNSLRSDSVTLTLFLAKFLATKNKVLKGMLMDYVVTHYNEIPDKYKSRVKEEFVECSKVEYLSKKAMSCLDSISRGYLPEEV